MLSEWQLPEQTARFGFVLTILAQSTRELYVRASHQFARNTFGGSSANIGRILLAIESSVLFVTHVAMNFNRAINTVHVGK